MWRCDPANPNASPLGPSPYNSSFSPGPGCPKCHKPPAPPPPPPPPAQPPTAFVSGCTFTYNGDGIDLGPPLGADAAETDCIRKGGHLASIHNQEQQDAIDE
eukprot:COSAG04_NODE_19842_length_407_cov_0.597403_1_plen_101_part_01